MALALTTGSVALLAAPPARRVIRRALARRWAAGVCRVLGIRIHERGDPPRGPALIAANHLGYLDIVVLLARTGAVFVAKREVSGWPVVGLLARATGTVFVDRARPRDAVRTLAAVARALDRGERVVLFPEGTSSDGRAILPLRPALLEAAAGTGVPLYGAVLAYITPPGTPPAAEAVCWWGDMTFLPHLLGLARLPAVEARVTWGSAPVPAADRKTLAERLHRELVALHGPAAEAPWAPPRPA